MNEIKIILQNTLMSSAYNISNIKLAQYFKSNDAAILIGNLISKDRYFEEYDKEKYNGWFFSTVEQIENDTACSERTQRRIFEILKSINLIEIKVKGVPPKRYFKINYGTLKALISVNSCETQESNLAKRKNQILRNASYINNIQVNNIKRVLSARKENSNPPIKYLNLSNKLSEIIRSKRNVKHSNKILNSWAADFKKLNKIDGVPIERQKEVLDWYSNRIGGEYIPVVQSGSSFREKFSNLEAAILKEQSTKQKRNNSIGYRGGYEIQSETITM